MFRHLLILLCLLCVAIPVSSFVDTQIEHLSRGGSGACISFSSGNQLYSTIGHSVGGHMRSVLDAGRKGGAIGPEIFATSGALNAGKELRAGLDPNYPNPLNPTGAGFANLLTIYAPTSFVSFPNSSLGMHCLENSVLF